MFVQRTILKQFTEDFVKNTAKLVIGDPLDYKTQVGATISKAHAEKVLGYISGAVAEVIILKVISFKFFSLSDGVNYCRYVYTGSC